MSKHTVIYVPGIGDDVGMIQGSLVGFWKLHGVNGVIHEMPWMDTEPYAPKHQRLLQLIDTLHAQGHLVSLVGTSAGAGAVINAFADRRDIVNGVVCLVGKVNNPDTIGNGYRKRSPAFIESAAEVQFSLDKLSSETDRARIMSRYAVFDETVARDDSVVAGAVNRTVFSVGHAITIIQQLLFGAPIYLRFLKRLAK